MLSSLALVSFLFCGVGIAFEKHEFIASVVMTNQDAYPGSSMLAAIYLKNNSSDILTIQYVGVQFDWMSSDRFLGYDLSTDPVVIPPYTDHVVDSITIPVPQDAALGEHTYFVGVDGLEGTEVFTWDSSTFTLLVRDLKEKEYDALLTQVTDNITLSENQNYQSSTAQSLLTQAKTAHEQALDYADQNSWNDAISKLNNALTDLQQASIEEQIYLAEKNSQDTSLITLGVTAVVIVVVLVLLYIIIKNKTSKQESVVDRAGIEPAAS